MTLMKTSFIIILKNTVVFFTASLLLSCSAAQNNSQEGAVIVLCYHTMLGRDFDTDFSESEFKKHLDRFEELGYSFVSYEQIVQGKISGLKNILITFDDGHRTNYEVYKRVLKPRGIKPLFAIFPAIIGKKHYAMTWENVKTLHEDGCEIASHGYYHLFLNDKEYENERQLFIDEIFRSKRVLENQLEAPVRVFVYPYGVYNQKAKEFILEAGYETAFTVNPGPLLSPLERNKNLLLLPRYIILKSTWDDFSEKFASPETLEHMTFAEYRRKVSGSRNK